MGRSVAIEGNEVRPRSRRKATQADDWIRERLRLVYGAVVAEPLPAYMTETIKAIRFPKGRSRPLEELRLEGKSESQDANHI